MDSAQKRVKAPIKFNPYFGVDLEFAPDAFMMVYPRLPTPAMQKIEREDERESAATEETLP